MGTTKLVDLTTYQSLSAEQISDVVEKDIKFYKESFTAAFSKVLNAYQKKKDVSDKTDLKHIYICLLRSSITQNLPLFRIDLYNESETEDMDECTVDWDVVFTDQLYARIPKVKENLHTDKENNMLAEKYWHEEAEIFFRTIKDYLPKIIESCKQSVSADMQWHYGEYLDQCELIM